MMVRLCNKYICIVLLTLLVFFCSCSDNRGSQSIHSAYYWTTTYKMSPAMTDFINKNNVERLYIRFFDVVMDPSESASPNATLQFLDTIPDSLEIVPTVFLMNDCMMADVDDLAEKVVKRVLQMCETHHVRNVKEIQMDCDWTRSTQDRYFVFLSRCRSLAEEKGLNLSATIRLHQLSMTVPPVDRGVLMVYNTGDVKDCSVKNPIFDAADVKPYLQYLNDYDLPLSAAYPIFSWNVLYRGDRFVGILHNENEYVRVPGDTVITYVPDKDEVYEIKEIIDRVKSEVNDEIVIYDLSDRNLEKDCFCY